MGVQEGQRLMMMGTTDEIVNAPEKSPVFYGRSSGRRTSSFCGSFCWIVQSWKYLLHELHSPMLAFSTELKSALIEYSQSGRSNDLDQSSHLLTVATRNLFTEIDKNVLKKKYPQFGQLHNGSFMQQDAEECWSQIFYTLSQALTRLSSRHYPNETCNENIDTMNGLFGVDLVSRYLLGYIAQKVVKKVERQNQCILLNLEAPRPGYNSYITTVILSALADLSFQVNEHVQAYKLSGMHLPSSAELLSPPFFLFCRRF
ncbi:hypothetical protein LXL04_019238 [Taraxacum kok-saghyz]